MRTWVPLMVLVMVFSIMAYAGAQKGEVCSLSDKLTICGYGQMRYDGGDKLPAGADDPEDFTLRQAYLNVIANPNERCTFVLTLATFDPNPPQNSPDDIIVYNLFMDYKLNDVYSVRFGQVPTYFGLEAWQGSSERVALERAAILQSGPGALGFYFASASDRGIWLKRTGEGNSPDVYFGICNGQSMDRDYDSNKNYSIDLKWDRDWGMFGVSWLDGTLGPSPLASDPAVETDRKAIDAYVKYRTTGWDLQAEYADGKLLGADRDGWYVQVCKIMEGKTWKPYLKYEEYNADAPGTASDVEYDALHGGVEWQVDNHNELTVQVSDVDLGSDDAVKFGVSWQMSF
jgi:hypothetical protein